MRITCTALRTALGACLHSVRIASPLLLVFVMLIISVNVQAAYWNATYYYAAPVWNVDYTGNQAVIWSSAGSGVDEPVWTSTSNNTSATFSVSNSGMLTHLSIEGAFDYAELLYGWSIHTILELNGLLPGETAQVSIDGAFEATTKCMVYTHTCPFFPFDYAEAWIQVSGVLSATVENTFYDQVVKYNVNDLDADSFSCSSSTGYVPPEDRYETSDYHNSADLKLFGGNTFTAINGFTVELMSDFYLSSYVDAGSYINENTPVRSLAEGFGNQFDWQVVAVLDAPIPIPDAIWLLLSGLLGIIGVGRRDA